MATFTLKQGSTLQLFMAVSNDDGTAFDLSTVTATSWVRDPVGRLIAQLALTPTSIPGQIYIKQETDDWPYDIVLNLDFKFTAIATGIVLKSETMTLAIEEAITS